MNKLTTLADDLTSNRGLVLILTKDKARNEKTNLIANLIMRGQIFVISGDEWMPAFELSRMIRRQTRDVEAIMNHLRLARAATCYRLLDSLASTDSKGEPVLVMDFLHTFYDPDIPFNVRLRKLRECCNELRRLAFYRPIILMIQETKNEDYEKFMPAVDAIIDKRFAFETELEPESVKQSTFF